MFTFLVTVITVLVLYPLSPPSKKTTHWILVVSGAVGMPKSDVNNGKTMALTDSPNYEVFPCIPFSPPIKDAVCWSARCWHMLACADQHCQHVHRFWLCWSDISNADLISRLYVTYVTYVTHFTNPPPTFRERINREVVVVLLMPTHIYIYSYIYIYIVCVCQHQIST